MKDLPGFFKVFLPSRSAERLQIPQAFVASVNGRIPDKAFLRNRCGKCWPVEVTNVGKDVFFTDGWVKLIEDNSVEYGDCFVFDYDGSSVFDFTLLGRNGCEKAVLGPSDLIVEEEEEEEEYGDHEDENYNEVNDCAVDVEEVLGANTLSKKTEQGKSKKAAKGLGIEEDEEEENDSDDNDDDDRDDDDYDEEDEKYKVEDDNAVRERDEEYKEADEEELEASTSRKKTKKEKIEKSGLLDLDGDKGEGAVKGKDGCRRINVFNVEDDEDIFEHRIISLRKNLGFVANIQEKRQNVLVEKRVWDKLGKSKIKDPSRGLGIEEGEEEEDDGDHIDDDDDDDDMDDNDYDEDDLKASSSRKKEKQNSVKSGKGAAKVDGGCRRMNVIDDDDDEDIFKYGIISPPKNPYFVAKLRQRRKYELYVPVDVIRDHKLELPQNLIMLDENGKKWSSEVKLWKDGRTWLTGGWRPFCKWNYFKSDDRCICEFVRGRGRQGIFLKMCIVRAGSWLPKSQKGVQIR